MRILTTFLVFITLTTFGQEKKIINGIILDSLTKEPIAFANIIGGGNLGTISDHNGNFKLTFIPPSPTQITIASIGYKRKIINTLDTTSHYIIELIKDTFDFDAKVEITGNPLDTSFYKNGQIKTINYQYQQRISYYESGNLKSKADGLSTRQWYENGNLKYQSISYNTHSKSVTEWYKNGQVKAHGTMYWGHNEKTNSGNWFIGDNWTYWNKNGKERKKKKRQPTRP